MDILYISHCVPWPPDKGDRIRAYYSVRTLLEYHRVHLAALARTEEEATAPSDLRDRLASLRIEVLDLKRAIMRGFAGFAAGESFTIAFHRSPALRAHVLSVMKRYPIGAVVLLSSSMAPYATDAVPFIADWGDVDSEKRLQYARMRFLGFAHRLEALRLRQVERGYALRARRTFLTTPNELGLFERIAPGASLGCAGNGVNAEFFDPAADFAIPEDLRRRNFIVFVGVLSYFPNTDGVCWFAKEVFPLLRQSDPELELLLVGRNPTRRVGHLACQDGVTVTGAVADVRPYLAAARGVIAPLRIARGVQNKVLEALAMGKQVLASEEVCRTLMPDLPHGLVRCLTPADYRRAVAALPPRPTADIAIAEAACARFSWTRNLDPLLTELANIEREHAVALNRSHGIHTPEQFRV